MHSNEWPQTGKTLVVILGACGAGKSTLTRALCGVGGTEHTAEIECYDRRTQTYVRERAKFVPGNSGIAIAGQVRNDDGRNGRACPNGGAGGEPAPVSASP